MSISLNSKLEGGMNKKNVLKNFLSLFVSGQTILSSLLGDKQNFKFGGI